MTLSVFKELALHELSSQHLPARVSGVEFVLLARNCLAV